MKKINTQLLFSPLMIILYVIIGLFIIWAGWSYYIVASIEKPRYEVLENRDSLEIRQYDSYILAQTEVSTSSMRNGLNSGFSIVANYIFGDNTKQQDIAMTTPVFESESEKIAMTAPVIESESEKIAMTSPVLEEEKEGGRTVSFVLPSKYTMETLPEPNDERVKIIQVPERKIAVLRFGWYPTESRVDAKKEELLQLIDEQNLIQTGPIESAFYNPPLSFPLLLRNEVWVPIK